MLGAVKGITVGVPWPFRSLEGLSPWSVRKARLVMVIREEGVTCWQQQKSWYHFSGDWCVPSTVPTSPHTASHCPAQSGEGSGEIPAF